MSEIKPVYQRRIQDDDWQEIEHSEYVEFSERGKFQTRILYPAAAYEALENERDELKQSLDDLQERFNGIKFIESELRKENDSLNAEVLRLKNELIASLKDWHDTNANHEALQKENAELQLRLDAKTLSHQLMIDRTLGLQKETAAQEKRIADLEETLNYYKNMVGA